MSCTGGYLSLSQRHGVPDVFLMCVMYRGLSVSLPLSLGVTPDTNAPHKCRLHRHLRECHGVLLLIRGKRQRIRQHIFFLLLLILSCSGLPIPGVGGGGGDMGEPLGILPPFFVR
jgi:hypothetical protein